MRERERVMRGRERGCESEGEGDEREGERVMKGNKSLGHKSLLRESKIQSTQMCK